MKTIYYFPTIPTKVHAATVVWVALGAVAIAILASILPGSPRRAAASRAGACARMSEK